MYLFIYFLVSEQSNKCIQNLKGFIFTTFFATVLFDIYIFYKICGSKWWTLLLNFINNYSKASKKAFLFTRSHPLHLTATLYEIILSKRGKIYTISIIFVYIFNISLCSFHVRFVDTGEMPDTFPYRTKALFAFEEIDGVDVCFFGMHVQEYGSECPFPNTRLVCFYAYIDESELTNN